MTNSYLAIINTFGETSVWPNLGQDFWSNLTPSHYVDARFDSFRAMRRSQIGSRMARSYSGILVFCTKIYRISYINVTELIISKYDMTKLFFIICRFSDKLGYFLSATVNWRRRRLAFGDYESSPIAASAPTLFCVGSQVPGPTVPYDILRCTYIRNDIFFKFNVLQIPTYDQYQDSSFFCIGSTVS